LRDNLQELWCCGLQRVNQLRRSTIVTRWAISVRRTRAQRRIYRYADVLGRTLDAWKGVQTVVEKMASELK